MKTRPVGFFGSRALWVGVALVFASLIPRAGAAAVEDARKAFAAGDYAAAARSFETALASSGPDAGLYYNLGLAQMRQSQPAEAALSLRRAIMLDPRMVDARVALSDLERSMGISLPLQSTLARWRDTIAERVPVAALAVTGSLMAWVGAFWLLGSLLRTGWKWRTVLASLILLALGKGLVAAGYLADPRVSERTAAVVMSAQGAELRSAPADQSAVVAKIPSGGKLSVRRKSGDWTYCVTPAGEKGWTSSAALTRVAPPA